MSSDGLKTLRHAIQTANFAPAYYLHGEEDFLKDSQIAELVDAAVEPAMRAFNVDTRHGGDLGVEGLSTLLETGPVMAPRRVVIIRDVHALKKQPRQYLDQYLKHPAPDLVLVLTTPASGKADKELLSTTAGIQIDALSGDR